MSLAIARSQRDLYLQQLALGNDPREFQRELEQQKAEAEANTLRVVTDRWFEDRQLEISKDYAEDLYKSLQNHVFRIVFLLISYGPQTIDP